MTSLKSRGTIAAIKLHVGKTAIQLRLASLERTCSFHEKLLSRLNTCSVNCSNPVSLNVQSNGKTLQDSWWSQLAAWIGSFTAAKSIYLLEWSKLFQHVDHCSKRMYHEYDINNNWNALNSWINKQSWNLADEFNILSLNVFDDHNFHLSKEV